MHQGIKFLPILLIILTMFVVILNDCCKFTPSYIKFSLKNEFFYCTSLASRATVELADKFR
jgi:hypothetical protein